jgi:DNA-binding transcriptional regulator GbsR (MarR family)
VNSKTEIDVPMSGVPDGRALSAFQREVIDLFVHAAQAVSLPRSIGEIYGLLYSMHDPVTMDDVIARLRISRGSASQGLRWLRAIGAIRPAYVNGDRRDHYVAETELRRLAGGFLREQVERRLDSGAMRLERINAVLAEEEDPDFATGRLRKLRRWHTLIRGLLPLFRRIAKGD